MKLSTYIKHLQKALKAHWDINIAYASDDEGNSYQWIQFEPTLFYVDKNKKDDDYLDLIQADDDVDKYIKKENQEKILVIN